MPVSIDRLDCWVLRAPVPQPVVTSFGVMDSRPAVLLRVSATDGAWGWGEVFCNFPQVGAEHRARLALSIFAPLIAGRASDQPAQVWEALDRQTRRVAIQSGELGPFAQVIGGIDQALWDMAARRAGRPLWELLARPGATGRVRVYASGIGPGQVTEMASAARRAGHAAFKFKVGFGPQTDQRNFAELRSTLGPDATIMVDANQAWDTDTAARQIDGLAPFGPYWVEEPLAADEPVSDWVALARRCGVPLAAGENLRGRSAFDEALSAGYLSFVQPDVGKWGGISLGREIAEQARRQGIDFCPHWLGGGVGLAASLHLRAATGEGGFAEVDVNPNPLRDEVFPIQVSGGWVTLPPVPGLGVEPDLGRLARYVRAA
jgi:L-alanine-DL-glutamate epimerase-like enolase superfamily enzyme